MCKKLSDECLMIRPILNFVENILNNLKTFTDGSLLVKMFGGKSLKSRPRQCWIFDRVKTGHAKLKTCVLLYEQFNTQ